MAMSSVSAELRLFERLTMVVPAFARVKWAPRLVARRLRTAL